MHSIDHWHFRTTQQSMTDSLFRPFHEVHHHPRSLKFRQHQE